MTKKNNKPAQSLKQAKDNASAQDDGIRVSGGKVAILMALALGLCIMAFWVLSFRVDQPSMTMQPRGAQQHTADDGHDHSEDDPAVMREQGNMKMISELMQKLQEDPENVHVLHTLGEQFMRMQQWERASQLLNRALVVEPQNTSVLNLLGICDFNREKFKEAASKFELIIELEPKNMMARYNLGILYGHFLNDKEKARGYMKAVAESEDVPPDTRKQAREELKGLK